MWWIGGLVYLLVGFAIVSYMLTGIRNKTTSRWLTWEDYREMYLDMFSGSGFLFGFLTLAWFPLVVYFYGGYLVLRIVKGKDF